MPVRKKASGKQSSRKKKSIPKQKKTAKKQIISTTKKKKVKKSTSQRKSTPSVRKTKSVRRKTTKKIERDDKSYSISPIKDVVGTNNKILEINLTKKTFETVYISNKDREMYLGGRGLGLKLLFDRLEPGIDPLGEDNMIAIMTGVLMGTGAPCSGRFAAVTKSPLTGIMASSSCGGPFGMALKTSGWDGFIIKGKASTPMYIVIDSKGVAFRDAKRLWKKDTVASQNALEKEGNGALVIGPAGENLVPYSNICSGHRYLGRGGMGAVLGSKKLKAIVARGKEFKIIPVQKEKFDKVKRKAINYINRNYITSGSYRAFGTSTNVNLSNAGGLLPVNNFRDGSSEEAYKISGEVMQEKFNAKFHTCKPCSILCGHKGNFNGKERQIPEYETVSLLGSNLGVFDPVIIAEWNELCGLLGIDTISAGGTIAWVMEATEKGLIKSKLKFGSSEGITKALKDIATLKGFGKEMAMGSKALSEKYGGKEYAMHVKGLEIAAYDPRGCFGHGLSYATANRGGCHLSASLFTIEVYFNMASPKAKRGKGMMVKYFENLFAALNSLHICTFTAFAFTLEPPLIRFTLPPVLKLMMQNLTPLALGLMDISLWPELWSTTTGIKMGMRKYLKTGERIHVLERYMNTREGISRKDDTLPERFLNEGRRTDPNNRTVPLEKMLNSYYRGRGFDNNGIPTDKLLKKLDIEKR